MKKKVNTETQEKEKKSQTEKKKTRQEKNAPLVVVWGFRTGHERARDGRIPAAFFLAAGRKARGPPFSQQGRARNVKPRFIHNLPQSASLFRHLSANKYKLDYIVEIIKMNSCNVMAKGEREGGNLLLAVNQIKSFPSGRLTCVSVACLWMAVWCP